MSKILDFLSKPVVASGTEGFLKECVNLNKPSEQKIIHQHIHMHINKKVRSFSREESSDGQTNSILDDMVDQEIIGSDEKLLLEGGRCLDY